MLNRKPSPTAVVLAIALASVLAAVQCGGNNNTPAPTPPVQTAGVASVAVSPASITAGSTGQGTVTLTTSGGSTVTLTSSNTGVATVPASVNVASGSTTATFTVSAVAPGSATITASAGGTQGAATVTVVAAGVQTLALSLSAATVVGGNSVTGTVALGQAAGAGGATVNLQAVDPVTVPATVTIPAGQTAMTFPVNTRAVGGAFTNTITATFGSLTAQAIIIVTPIVPTESVVNLTLNPATVAAGSTSQGTVTLDNAAPSGGASIALSSSNSGVASVPASITIPQGSTTGTFTISTTSVTASTQVTITASHGATQTAMLTVNPNTPIARFTVSGPSGTNTCKLINSGNAFDCTFDGSASTASSGATVIQWNWSYTIAGTKSESSAGSTLTPNPNCGLLPPAPLPSGTTSLQMTVNLTVRDTLATNSMTTSNNNVRVLPQGVCGF